MTPYSKHQRLVLHYPLNGLHFFQFWWEWGFVFCELSISSSNFNQASGLHLSQLLIQIETQWYRSLKVRTNNLLINLFSFIINTSSIQKFTLPLPMHCSTLFNIRTGIEFAELQVDQWAPPSCFGNCQWSSITICFQYNLIITISWSHKYPI